MGEGRYSKLGRFDASVINQIIDLLPQEIDKEEYKIVFLKELRNYSDKGRKKGEPENEGCVRELEYMTRIDITNPKDLARWLKEHQHTKYQKDNVRRERKMFFKFF